MTKLENTGVHSKGLRPETHDVDFKFQNHEFNFKAIGTAEINFDSNKVVAAVAFTAKLKSGLKLTTGVNKYVCIYKERASASHRLNLGRGETGESAGSKYSCSHQVDGSSVPSLPCRRW